MLRGLLVFMSKPAGTKTSRGVDADTSTNGKFGPTLLIPEGPVHSAKHQAACEINHLWRLALAVLPKDPGGLSAGYVRQLEARAASSEVDTTFLKGFYCGGCKTPFLPGLTCTVKLHHRNRGSQARVLNRRRARKSGIPLSSENIPTQEVAYCCMECGHTVCITGGTQKQQNIKLLKRKIDRDAKRQVHRAQSMTSTPDRNQDKSRNIEDGKKRVREDVSPPKSSTPASFIGEQQGRKKKKKKKTSATSGSALSKFLGSL